MRDSFISPRTADVVHAAYVLAVRQHGLLTRNPERACMLIMEEFGEFVHEVLDATRASKSSTLHMAAELAQMSQLCLMALDRVLRDLDKSYSEGDVATIVVDHLIAESNRANSTNIHKGSARDRKQEALRDQALEHQRLHSHSERDDDDQGDDDGE